MNGLNALIATGGGYQPPAFDYATNKRNMLAAQTQGLQNKLLQQQVEAQPEQQKIQELRFKLEKDLFDLEKKAFSMNQGEEVTSEVAVGDEVFEVSGRAGDVAKVIPQIRKNIDKVDEETIPWAASQGVGIKKKEPKAPIMGSEEWKKAKQFEAGLKPDKPTSFEEKMQAILGAYPGMDRNTATRIAAGTVRVITDPYTGNVALVDVGTGEQLPMGMRGAKPTQPTPKEGQPEATIWDMADLATGPWSAGLAGLGTVSGMVGLPTAEKTDYARQFIRSAQNDLIRALSINPRFPVGEIKRLQEEINISPKIVDNPEKMKTRARAVDNYLRRRLEKELRTSSDVNVPMNDRKAASSAAKDIESFLGLLGVPQGPNPGNVEDGYRFKGGDPANPDNWEKVD